MVLFRGSVKSLAPAQTLSRLHSSGASCPMLSRLAPTRAPSSHKGLAVLASPYSGLITFAGEDGLTSEVPNYVNAPAEDAPAHNRCLYLQSLSCPYFAFKETSQDAAAADIYYVVHLK